jgi:hypothetical protein
VFAELREAQSFYEILVIGHPSAQARLYVQRFVPSNSVLRILAASSGFRDRPTASK